MSDENNDCYRASQKVRWRPHELEPGNWAVTERTTGLIIIRGLPSYERAWCWLSERMDQPGDE
jgi:hypothetical protein